MYTPMNMGSEYTNCTVYFCRAQTAYSEPMHRKVHTLRHGDTKQPQREYSELYPICSFVANLSPAWDWGSTKSKAVAKFWCVIRMCIQRPILPIPTVYCWTGGSQSGVMPFPWLSRSSSCNSTWFSLWKHHVHYHIVKEKFKQQVMEKPMAANKNQQHKKMGEVMGLFRPPENTFVLQNTL